MAGNAAVATRMRSAAVLMRQRGLDVGAFSGWSSAGRSSTMAPRAVLCHHTAASVDVDRILRDGRNDLPGPLCNWALHRDGSWWLVASGRANHAGVGVLASSESYGIEATGPVPVTSQGVSAFPNYKAYVLGVACILEVEGWPASVVYGHKETARPDGRKPDPAFGDGYPTPYLDMDRFRDRVHATLIGEDEDLTPEQDQRLTRVEDLVERLVKATLVKVGTGTATEEIDQALLSDRRQRFGTSAGGQSGNPNLRDVTVRLGRIEAAVQPADAPE